MRAPRSAPISSPSATRAPDATTRRADLDSGGGEPRNQMANQLDRVNIDRRRRQAIADRRSQAGTDGASRLASSSARGRIEHAPEIGTPEIIAAGCAAWLETSTGCKTKTAEARDQARTSNAA